MEYLSFEIICFAYVLLMKRYYGDKRYQLIILRKCADCNNCIFSNREPFVRTFPNGESCRNEAATDQVLSIKYYRSSIVHQVLWKEDLCTKALVSWRIATNRRRRAPSTRNIEYAQFAIGFLSHDDGYKSCKGSDVLRVEDSMVFQPNKLNINMDSNQLVNDHRSLKTTINFYLTL